MAFNLESYLGLWYEIARSDNNFETGCTDTTAKYSLVNGNIRVENRCLVNGKPQIVIGTGYPSTLPGGFLVDFNTGRVGVYLVLWTDYKYAVVSGDSNFWILSRTPTVSKAKYAELLKLT